MKVTVLRIGHRFVRDYRVTTHVALVARAFGAEKILVTEVEDQLKKTVKEISERWGGHFEIEEIKNWKSAIQRAKSNGSKIVHLTMYGINVDDIVGRIRNEKDLMVVIGAEKVPREVYEISDYNVAIGNQPHSEIAALAIFLDRLFEGKQFRYDFNGKVNIIPSANDKVVKTSGAS
ncbi:MAG: tRNA (cytidine(56)-2'-O)-methyltransferase [Nitrososphaerales archaeon]